MLQLIKWQQYLTLMQVNFKNIHNCKKIIITVERGAEVRALSAKNTLFHLEEIPFLHVDSRLIKQELCGSKLTDTMKYNHSLLMLALGSLSILASCRKKETKEPETSPTENPAPSYTVPTTYNFGTNMSFKTSAQRIEMLAEIIDYIETTHNATVNISISASALKNMYSNIGNPFSKADLNTSGNSLKEKTSNAFGMLSQIDAVFDEVAAASQGTVNGSDGVAGKVVNHVGTQSAYLLDKNGFEYREVVEKNGMAAIFYSEATTILKNIGSYDNSTITNGEGTAMEHAWDIAFGYFGVPVNFPANISDVEFWGEYCNETDAAIGTNVTMMNAWLRGRAAISNRDYAERDAARNIIVATWEKICATQFIIYMKECKLRFANNAKRNHNLSEGIGFIHTLKYNPAKTISDADIEEVLGYMGTNFYQITLENINSAIDKVAKVFNLDTNKL
jgi:hypothetical protein